MEKNNLNQENIFKKNDFIFYLFKNKDKFEDAELTIIKQLLSFNIDIFFIISHITEDDEESSKSYFEDKLIEKYFSKQEIKRIIDNTFCLDFLDIQYSNKLSQILDILNNNLEKYKISNNYIIKCIDNFNNNLSDSKITDYKKSLINESNRKEGILTEIAPNDPNDLIKIIQEEIKNNIFFIDLETDRNTKYNRSLEILYSYEKSAFWWGLVPILDDYLSKLSRIRMINKISEIYKSVVLKRIKDKNIKEYNEGERKTFVDLKYTAYLLPIQILLKSFENQIFTRNLGIKVIKR